MKDEYKEKLSPEQYRVLREGKTEFPFEGEYVNHKEFGIYTCAACNNTLFSSKEKFDSGSGWPSFTDVFDEKNIELVNDKSQGMHRIEVRCSRCHSHLGHVFDDGPLPTRKRFCINSLSLNFEKKDL